MHHPLIRRALHLGALLVALLVTATTIAEEAGDGLAVMGELDPAVVRRVIARQTAQTRACAPAGRDALAGRVALRWVIGADGRVEADSVTVAEDTAGDQALSTCLVAKVQGWQFPRPRGGTVTVTYPFTFGGPETGAAPADSDPDAALPAVIADGADVPPEARDAGERGDAVGPAADGADEPAGSLPPAIIQRVVRQHQREVKHCYEQALLRGTTLAGKVTVAWTITQTGDVSQVKVESSEIADDPLLQCVRSKIARWRFPAPSGGGVVRVTYPFNLTSP